MLRESADTKRGIVIPLINTVLLPGVSSVLKVTNLTEKEIATLENVDTPSIGLPLKQNFSQKSLRVEDFYRIGITFRVTGVEKTEKGYDLSIKVLERIEVKSIDVGQTPLTAEYITCASDVDINETTQNEMLEYLKNITREFSNKFHGAEPYITAFEEIRDINSFIVYLTQFMPITNADRYDLIETQSLKERGLKFIDQIIKLRETLELQVEMSEKFSDKANKYYRETVLREQLKAIQDELNEGKSDGHKKETDYEEKINEAGMTPEAKSAALDEAEKLKAIGTSSPEYAGVRNYLELLIHLPWKKSERTTVNLGEARRILDEQHYGLEKVKDRIVQHLAVMQLKKGKRGSILLLVGPPGTGKTSLGKSIADALGRKYIRLSLGGIRDEAEIRGHRRTYVGSMPGRIISGMKKAGETNPVMVLDEVDKLMAGGFSGDPQSALLEVLDPEQNNTFQDHYLDLPYDLSDVFFIATANSVESIPAPLLDRMEMIQISSYTAIEKFHIAKDHLIPSVLEEHGLSADQLVVPDEVLRTIIAEYTLEAGVRGLKKQLAAIARATSEKVVSNTIELPYIVSADGLDDALGRKTSRHDMAQNDNPPGVVTGLAWTPVGGEILFVEATDMDGSGEVTLTGQLGDVMKESARISLSLLKSRLPLNSINFKKRDLHIHVPSGSVPKDGPSAGIALFTAIASLITGIKVDPKVAMTGEITLRGAVLPIGGLKEKLLGAQRAGIAKVLIPKDNVIDLKDVSAEVKEQLAIVPVETIEDVLKETLGISLPRIEHVFGASGGASLGHVRRKTS